MADPLIIRAGNAAAIADWDGRNTLAPNNENSREVVVDTAKNALVIGDPIAGGAFTMMLEDMSNYDGTAIPNFLSTGIDDNADSNVMTLNDDETATFAGAVKTSVNVGAAGTNVTAVEYGDAYQHVTVLTLAAVDLTPNLPNNVEALGAIIYTFPVGVYVAKSCHMDITAGLFTDNNVAAECGIGSVIATGDISTLATGTFEDYVLGTGTIADAGASFVKELSTVMTNGSPLLFESGGSHVVHINVAATWTDAVAPANVTGTVTIAWDFLGA